MELIGILDSWVLNFFPSIRDGFLNQVFKFITVFGEWWIVAIITVVVSVFLLVKKKKIHTLLIWLVVVGAAVDTFILKKLIHRQRPVGGLVDETSFSFPSMHGALSVVLYGFIVYLLWNSTISKPAKILLTIAAIILVTFIGFSRLYLGVHYFSDVLGGYILGLLWLGLGIYIDRRIIKNGT